MEYLIIAGIVLYFVLKVFKFIDSLGGSSNRSSDRDGGRPYGNEEELSRYYSGYVNNGYICYKIKGTSFRGLRKQDIGTFDGEAIAELNNIYDDHAVAIYGNQGKMLGYIPAGQKDLHQYISKRGRVRAVGYINGNRKCFWGEVYVKFDYNEWAELIPIEEKTYARANLRDHYMTVSNHQMKRGTFSGTAKPLDIGSEPFPIGIYDDSGNKIGVVTGEMKVYFTIKLKEEKGEVPVWGKLGNTGNYVYIPLLCGQKKIANAKAKFEEQYSK